MRLWRRKINREEWQGKKRVNDAQSLTGAHRRSSCSGQYKNASDKPSRFTRAGRMSTPNLVILRRGATKEQNPACNCGGTPSFKARLRHGARLDPGSVEADVPRRIEADKQYARPHAALVRVKDTRTAS
jgi:hypothetical protein